MFGLWFAVSGFLGRFSAGINFGRFRAPTRIKLSCSNLSGAGNKPDSAAPAAGAASSIHPAPASRPATKGQELMASQWVGSDWDTWGKVSRRGVEPIESFGHNSWNSEKPSERPLSFPVARALSRGVKKRLTAELVFDAQQALYFPTTFAAAEGAGLDLPARVLRPGGDRGCFGLFAACGGVDHGPWLLMPALPAKVDACRFR